MSPSGGSMTIVPSPATRSPTRAERQVSSRKQRCPRAWPGVCTTRIGNGGSPASTIRWPSGQLAVDREPAAGEPLGRRRMGQDRHAQGRPQARHAADVVRVVVGEPDRHHLAAEPVPRHGQGALQPLVLLVERRAGIDQHRLAGAEQVGVGRRSPAAGCGSASGNRSTPGRISIRRSGPRLVSDGIAQAAEPGLGAILARGRPGCGGWAARPGRRRAARPLQAAAGAIHSPFGALAGMERGLDASRSPATPEGRSGCRSGPARTAASPSGRPRPGARRRGSRPGGSARPRSRSPGRAGRAAPPPGGPDRAPGWPAGARSPRRARAGRRRPARGRGRGPGLRSRRRAIRGSPAAGGPSPGAGGRRRSRGGRHPTATGRRPERRASPP